MSDVLVTETPADGADGGGGARRRRIAPFAALAVAAVLAGLFWVLAGADSGVNDTADTYLLGRPAPRVRGTTIDGSSVDLSRRKGNWVVVNFFNSTCVPCVQEHPDLIAFTEQQAQIPDGAELYTVVNNDTDAAVRAFFDEHGGDWPVITDPDGEINVEFGISKVPETWIIDPDGIVVERFITRITAGQLSAYIQRLRELRA